MAWVFDSIVDSGRDRDQASGRKVFYARALFTSGQDQLCQTLFFYDTTPTAPQRTAAVQRLLDNLNAPPAPKDIVDDVEDAIRDALRDYAQRTGKTKAQIVAALQGALS
jgi:hypothetical protein